MTNQQQNHRSLKFSGSLALLLTVAGVLLALGGQLEFLGNERKKTSLTPMSKSNNNTKKPKYSFYDELKKRKTEVDSGIHAASAAVKNTKESPNDKFNYVVQVGAYSQKADANKIKKLVENLGFPARVINNGRKFLTQAGPFNGKNNANSAEKRLRSQQLDTLIKRLK